MRLAPAAIAALLLTLIPLAPSAGAAYGCDYHGGVGYVCTGVDPTDRCPTGPQRSDWGADFYGRFGITIAAGGTKECSIDEDGRTNVTRHMDAGVFVSGLRVGVALSETTLEGEEGPPERRCTERVYMGSAQAAPVIEQGCIALRPVHPHDNLLPPLPATPEPPALP